MGAAARRSSGSTPPPAPGVPVIVRINRSIRMAGRRLRVAALGVATAVLTAGLAACAEAHRGVVKPVDDCYVRYSLEVANGADDRIRVRMRVSNTSFSPPGAAGSGIVVLESGAKRAFEMAYGPIECKERLLESNKYIAYFAEIDFFDQRSDDPYRSYAYPYVRCLDRTCNRVYHQSSSNGTWENLFVESSDRPFYLERDREDSGLARIVITFAPSAESGSTNALEPHAESFTPPDRRNRHDRDE